VGIDHTYIYLCKRYTTHQDDALDEFSVRLGDYRKGLPVEEEEKAIAVPLRMHNSAPLTKIPYLIATKSLEPAEGEPTPPKLFNVTDIVPLIARHPDAFAPPGFTKLDFDLR
jgi:hypothetical protein